MHFFKFRFILTASIKQLLQRHLEHFNISICCSAYQGHLSHFSVSLILLRNITVTYPNLITKEITVFAYVDDILLANDNEESHLVENKSSIHTAY